MTNQCRHHSPLPCEGRGAGGRPRPLGGEALRAAVLLCLALLLTTSLASAQSFFPIGMHISSLNDLPKLGPELKAAGFNCVLADGPLGAACIPGLWQAYALGLRVYLTADALGTPTSDPDGTRDYMLKIFDLTSSLRDNPAYAGFWLNIDALRAEQVAVCTGAARSHASAELGAEAWLPVIEATKRPDLALDANIPLYADLARIDVPWEVPSIDAPPMTLLFSAPPTGATRDALLKVLQHYADMEQGIFFVDSPTPQAHQALLEAVKALKAGHHGMGFAQGSSLPLPGPSRSEVLASEASDPLLWTLKRFGEVTPYGLVPYITPDGTTGYSVAAHPLLDLPIPNRSALVDASKLTRFSMRMFSAVDGTGALLARSTAGEVSYLRLPIQGGWHVYELDLDTAKWESAAAAGLKWGGSTGLVQGLVLTPVPQADTQIAFDWIRLEPPATGEVLWPLEKSEEITKTEGLEGVAISKGELKGQATAGQVSLELALPASGLNVAHLPFLSFSGALPGEGAGTVEYWTREAGANPDQPGGAASLTWNNAQTAECFDLRHLGFFGANGVYWEGPHGPVTRLRLTLPATVGEAFVLNWVRLGPNYDLRAVPSEALPEGTAPGPNPQ